MYYISAFAGLLQDSVSEDRRLGEVARVLLLMFYDAVTGVVGSCCSGWEDVQHEVGVRLSVFMSGSLYFGLAGCATMCFSRLFLNRLLARVPLCGLVLATASLCR